MTITRNLTRSITHALTRPITQAGAGSVLLAPPAGFVWDGAPSIYATGTSYSTSFNIDDHRPATSVTYYIDPVAGSDANDGLTTGTPRAKLSTTVTLANAGGVAAKFLCKPGIYHGDVGWNGSVPTVNFIMEPWAADPTLPANRIWMVRPPAISSTWFLDSGSLYRGDSFFTTEPFAVFDVSSTSGGFPRKYEAAPDKATAAATPGSYWRDTAASRIYVRTVDSRALNGDKSIIVATTGGGNNFRFACTASVNMWVQNVCFIDGSNSLYVQSGAADLSIGVYMKDCQSVGSVLANGAAFISTHANTVMEVYQQRCGAGYNAFDGFNYRSDTGAGALVRYFEDECFTARNGYGAGGANNATTSHGTAMGISLNGTYAGSQNRVINDIEATRRWMLGCDIAASLSTDATAITVQAGAASGSHTSQIWLDGCTIAQSTTAEIHAETGCAVRYRNMSLTGLTVTGAGTVEAY